MRMQNCFPKVGPDSGKRQVTFTMVMLVLFHKDSRAKQIPAGEKMLTSYKTDYDYLSPVKYPLPMGKEKL